MRVYRFSNTGSFDNLRVVEENEPKPTGREVLVKMRAASFNYRDLMIAKGVYGGGGPQSNLIPLSDGAGEVVATGTEVTQWRKGDRVAGCFFPDWQSGEPSEKDVQRALGGSVDGVLAEFKIFDENALVRLPKNLSFQEGATLPCAALTAWNALFTERTLQPGQSVLTLGTGGVSLFALQFARMAGAKVFVTSSSDSKLAKAEKLGAYALINYKTHSEWDNEVLRLTENKGVDRVIEIGGPGTLPRSLNALRVGGSIHFLGVLSEGQFNPLPLIFKSAMVRGIYVGSRAMFEAMNKAIEANNIKPVIDKVFSFNEVKEAYRYMASGAHVGKIVVEIG